MSADDDKAARILVDVLAVLERERADGAEACAVAGELFARSIAQAPADVKEQLRAAVIKVVNEAS